MFWDGICVYAFSFKGLAWPCPYKIASCSPHDSSLGHFCSLPAAFQHWQSVFLAAPISWELHSIFTLAVATSHSVFLGTHFQAPMGFSYNVVATLQIQNLYIPHTCKTSTCGWCQCLLPAWAIARSLEYGCKAYMARHREVDLRETNGLYGLLIRHLRDSLVKWKL